jgi:hypothetical protein
MRQIRGRLMLLALICLFGLVFAYGLSRYGIFEIPSEYDPFAVPDLTAQPNILFPFKIKLLDADAQNCRIAFARTGHPVTIEPSRSEKAECVKQDTIKLASLSVAKLRTEETRCAIAARLFMWEHNVVQPAAQKYFREPVVEILHFGSYSCRNMRGSSSISEHATANAFDVSGFRLKSGKLISIKQHWQGSSPDARFLHDLRRGACDYFNLVLSPDYNAAHADHFHVDMGWWRGCN